MTCMKKLTALLVSAALALSLLAGCGGSKALSQVMADLLSNLYDNVTVETDSGLTAALKKAAAAGSTQEEVLAALVENLNLSGGSITFNNLGDGQQGQHGVTLTFQPGSDPDAAARSALTQWTSVFGSLPGNGSYRAHVSMIEAENGYYIAVDVEVLRAGSHDKDDSDDDKDDEDGEDGGDDTTAYTQDKDENGNITSVTIKAKNGLQQLMDDLAKEGQNPATALAAADITLNCDVTLNDTWIPIGTEQTPYTGTFDGNDKIISGLKVDSNAQYVGLFGYIQGGTVQNLTLDKPDVKSTYTSVTVSEGFVTSTSIGFVGAVTGTNNGGTIKNCHITGGTISASAEASNAGGVVGQNGGEVIGCYTSGDVKTTATTSETFTGGVVGRNDGGTVTDCCSTSSVSGYEAGGVVGFNCGSVTVCYHANGAVEGTDAGGVVGYNFAFFGGTVTDCYWSGNQTKGIGDSFDSSVSDPTIQITESNIDSVWSALQDDMKDNGYTITGTWDNPTGLTPNT